MAAATIPPPLTARRSLPARARNPRREVDSATASLSTDGAGRVDEEALELVERGESGLRQHVALPPEKQRGGGGGDPGLAPGVGVCLLVEELQLALGIGRDQPQARLERLAEGAAGRC